MYKSVLCLFIFLVPFWCNGESAKFPEWLKNITLTQSHELEFETQYSPIQKAPESGQSDYRDVTSTRFGILSKFYARSPTGWRAHAAVKGYYDAIYALKGRGEYTSETLDEYERELEIRDLYLQGSLTKALDVKVGRQVVTWGYADFLRGTDILNPLDNRTPGLVDLEDIRLPVAMTRLDYYRDTIQAQLVLLHEFEEDRVVPFGSEFYSLPFPLPNDRERSYSLSNPGLGFSINKTLANGDLSIYYADLYSNTARFAGDIFNLRLVYDRIKKYGIAHRYLTGNWVLKWESTLTEGLGFISVDDEKNRWDALAGFEYAGWPRTVVILELLYQKILDFEQAAGIFSDPTEEETLQGVINIQYNFENPTWRLNTLLYSSDDLGHFQRVMLDKDIGNNLTLQTGYIHFASGDNILSESLDHNDKIIFKAKYTF